MLSRITNIGIRENQSLSEIRKIKLLNQIVIIFIAFVFLKFIGEILVQDFYGIVITVTLMLAYASVWALNRLGKYMYAHSLLIIMLTLSANALYILFGRGFGSEFYYFPIIMLIGIFVDEMKMKFLWFLYLIVSYMIAYWYIRVYGLFFFGDFNEGTFYVMFIAAGLVTFLITFVFIQENKQFEAQTNDLLAKIKLKNARLENANMELGKFAYVASHDLKTPLRNINSFLNLIQRKVKKGETSDIEEYLEFATSNAKRMHELVQDILEFSRFNKDSLNFENKDLNEVLKTTIANLQEIIKERSVILETTTLPSLFCNEQQIISLFQNLIENGIKYNKSDPPIIKINCIDLGEDYEISIIDNGIGIEEEYQDKVFNMFYRLHNQGEYTGSGIGLAICQKVAILHGGTISFTSLYGQGSTFKAILPKRIERK